MKLFTALDRPLCHVYPCLYIFLQGVPPAVGSQHAAQLLACAAPFQQAYLTGASGRMAEAVGQAFPGGPRAPLPSPTDVQRCIGYVGLYAVGITVCQNQSIYVNLQRVMLAAVGLLRV